MVVRAPVVREVRRLRGCPVGLVAIPVPDLRRGLESLDRPVLPHAEVPLAGHPAVLEHLERDAAVDHVDPAVEQVTERPAVREPLHLAGGQGRRKLDWRRPVLGRLWEPGADRGWEVNGI